MSLSPGGHQNPSPHLLAGETFQIAVREMRKSDSSRIQSCPVGAVRRLLTKQVHKRSAARTAIVLRLNREQIERT